MTVEAAVRRLDRTRLCRSALGRTGPHWAAKSGQEFPTVWFCWPDAGSTAR